jgi:vacuolar-type H+-ATPase subunit I/STV1
MNKTCHILAVFFLFLCVKSNAQQVQEVLRVMSLGTENGYIVQVAGADEKMAEKALKDYLHTYGKIKEQKKFKEFQLLNTPIAPVNGSNPLDLYVKIQVAESNAAISFWVRNQSGFVSTVSQQEISSRFRNFINNYQLVLEKDVAEKAWKQERDLLQKLEKDLKKLQENNKNYHQDIQKAKERIAEAEKNIEQNLKQQEMKTQEILDQHIRVQKAEEKYNYIGKKQKP